MGDKSKEPELQMWKGQRQQEINLWRCFPGGHRDPAGVLESQGTFSPSSTRPVAWGEFGERRNLKVGVA